MKKRFVPAVIDLRDPDRPAELIRVSVVGYLRLGSGCERAVHGIERRIAIINEKLTVKLVRSASAHANDGSSMLILGRRRQCFQVNLLRRLLRSSESSVGAGDDAVLLER